MSHSCYETAKTLSNVFKTSLEMMSEVVMALSCSRITSAGQSRASQAGSFQF